MPSTHFSVNGLVELLPLNNEFLLAMERSFSVGAPGTGNTIKLYYVSLPARDRRDGVDSLAGRLAGSARRRRRCCSTSTRSGSRSTTSRA